MDQTRGRRFGSGNARAPIAPRSSKFIKPRFSGVGTSSAAMEAARMTLEVREILAPFLANCDATTGFWICTDVNMMLK